MTAAPFDVCGPLPEGVAVLEASAGTGKTYTIAALAARYVAAGIPLDALLIVTFTRMATGELRERVRERLVSAERALEDVVRGAGLPDDEDAVAALLATGAPDEIAARRGRLARAVADFDAATITTTHGFCEEALGSLGFSGDVERDCTFVEDVSDLIDEVVDDLYVRRFFAYARRIGRDEVHAIARAAITNPGAALEPSDAVPDSDGAMRVRIATVAREELERRKRLASVMTFDDLLTRLDAALAGPGGEDVAARLRARYRIVLVDEFQDTDPVQWKIMRAAFAHHASTLVLIGDPKQAIYAFRGADVYAYIDAARSATTRATLDVNWRSDQPLLDAYDALFADAQLGHPAIVYHPVQAAAENRAARLQGAPVDAAVRVRVVDRRTVGTTRTGFAETDPARRHIARDLADDIVALLSARPTITTPAGPRRVLPGDVAVLVRRNRDAATVRELLEAAGVPAVINGAGSVFATDPARDWLALLSALERPTSVARAHAVALTPFLGWTAQRIATAPDDAWEAVHDRLHEWARVLRVSGVASLLAAVTLKERLPQRMLRVADGERALTDLRHVGQLLHGAATTEHLGTAALTAWLRRRIAEAEREADEERSRRLESDAAAVQVLTIHRSKGLEFPIVYYPYLWDPSWIPDKPETVFFHDPDNSDTRTLDVGMQGPAFARHQRLERAELRGEDLRLAYVALTRAQHQAVLWWAGTFTARHSPLGRLVFDRSASGEVPVNGAATPSDAAARQRFEQLAAQAPGRVSVEDAALGLPRSFSHGPAADRQLAAARFDRVIDRAWRRTSYSDITAQAHEPLVGSEPEARLIDDEHDDETPAAALPAEDGEALRGVACLLGDMPGGVHVGTLVHDVLEATDFAAADLNAEVALRVVQAQARRRVEVGDRGVVAAGLAAAIRTPLGPLLDELSLQSVARADRVDELVFELPLGGGDTASATVTPHAIGRLLREHLAPGDPLHDYAPRLESADLRAALRGYLTGSIDLVLRVAAGGSDARPRHAIVDYKTNRLGEPGVALSAHDYRPAALTAQMQRSHYALQGLLYSVALHRHLRWRIAGYDPDRDLAGIHYLFVRGMSGAATPRVGGVPCGVFSWRAPGALLEALSDLLDRGAAV